MAEAALCTVWGDPIPGREKQALNVYNEAMQYWARLQQKEKSSALTSAFSSSPVAT